MGNIEQSKANEIWWHEINIEVHIWVRERSSGTSCPGSIAHEYDNAQPGSAWYWKWWFWWISNAFQRILGNRLRIRETVCGRRWSQWKWCERKHRNLHFPMLFHYFTLESTTFPEACPAHGQGLLTVRADGNDDLLHFQCFWRILGNRLRVRETVCASVSSEMLIWLHFQCFLKDFE